MKWENPVSMHDGGGHLRSLEAFTGHRIVVLEGAGVTGDPVREVVHYFDEYGNRIGVADPFGQPLPDDVRRADA